MPTKKPTVRRRPCPPTQCHFDTRSPRCCNTSPAAKALREKFPKAWRSFQVGVDRAELFATFCAILTGTYEEPLPGKLTPEIEDTLLAGLTQLKVCLRGKCECAQDYWIFDCLTPVYNLLERLDTHSWVVYDKLDRRAETVTLVEGRLGLDSFNCDPFEDRMEETATAWDTRTVTYDGVLLHWHDVYPEGTSDLWARPLSPLELEAVEKLTESFYDRDDAVREVFWRTPATLAFALQYLQQAATVAAEASGDDDEDWLDLPGLDTVLRQLDKANFDQLSADAQDIAVGLTRDWTKSLAQLINAARLTALPSRAA